MTYAQRHKNDKSLKGERTGGTRPARASDVTKDPSGMVHKPIDGLAYTTMNDYDEPESSDNLKGRKGKGN